MRKELLIAGVIYFVTMFTLMLAIYRFVESWHLSTFNVFIAGGLVLLVAVGWGYVLTALIFAPTKKKEDTLSVLAHEIVHELNIPLATIQANSAMLHKSLSDEKSLRRLKRIEDASIRLKRLYDELVYRINKEIHPVEKEKFNVQEIIKHRVDIFKEQNRNTFILRLEPCWMEADKIGFEQMLDNLFSNAMKYSPKKAPIKVILSDAKLCIEDNGIGMNEVELLRVYERYFQSDESSEGEGIGLTLVKKYCEEENIEINIESEKNKGTKICLTLN